MKQKFLTVAASLFASVAVLAAVPAAQAAGSLDAIKAKKSISIGIPTDFAPYGFMGPDFQPQGVDVDTAKLIAAKLGVKADLVPVSTPNRIPYLQTNKVDLVISALGKTEERAKVIDFSIAYAPFYQGIFGPKSLTIKSFEDLAGKSIAVTRGTIQDDLLQKVAPPTLKIQRFEDDASTVTAFITQQTQLIATGGAVAAAAIAKNPQAQLEYKLLLKDSPCFVGLRKGDADLLEAVNGILRAAKADGTLEKISQHWLGRGTGELPE